MILFTPDINYNAVTQLHQDNHWQFDNTYGRKDEAHKRSFNTSFYLTAIAWNTHRNNHHICLWTRGPLSFSSLVSGQYPRPSQISSMCPWLSYCWNTRFVTLWQTVSLHTRCKCKQNTTIDTSIGFTDHKWRKLFFTFFFKFSSHFFYLFKFFYFCNFLKKINKCYIDDT